MRPNAPPPHINQVVKRRASRQIATPTAAQGNAMFSRTLVFSLAFPLLHPLEQIPQGNRIPRPVLIDSHSPQGMEALRQRYRQGGDRGESECVGKSGRSKTQRCEQKAPWTKDLHCKSVGSSMLGSSSNSHLNVPSIVPSQQSALNDMRNLSPRK